jgi:hypothetical protein
VLDFVNPQAARRQRIGLGGEAGLDGSGRKGTHTQHDRGIAPGAAKKRAPASGGRGSRLPSIQPQRLEALKSISNDGHPPSAAWLRSSVTARAALASAESARALSAFFVANISKLFRSLEKPSLAGSSFFVGR